MPRRARQGRSDVDAQMSLGAVRVICTLLIVAALTAAILADLRLAVPGRSHAYKVARLKNWLAAGMIYVLFYQARYAAAVLNTDAVRATLGLEPSGYGSLLIVGFWSYALATAINGAVVDRVGGRTGLLIGCIGCGVACLLCGLILGQPEASSVAYATVHMVNMSFNSLAALSVIRINVNWYNKRERGVFSGIFGVCIAVGYFVALTTGSWFYSSLPPKYVFFMPALTLLTIGTPLCLFVVRNKPDGDDGFTAPVTTTMERSDQRPSASSAHAQDVESNATAKAGPEPFLVSVKKILSIPSVQATAVGLLGCGWAREGFLSWFGSYLEATAGIAPGLEVSTIVTTAMSLCAIVGSLAGGFISDRFCKSERGPVLLVYCAGQLTCFLLLWWGQGSAAFSAVTCALLSIFLFGALSLLMAASSSDHVEPALAGMASGLLNAAQYMGSGSGAVVTGIAIEGAGWSAFGWCCSPGPILSAAGMLWLMRLRSVSAQP